MADNTSKNIWVGGVKAGKLANGWERGKGSVVHAIDEKLAGVWRHSICGAAPRIAWSERPIQSVSCPKCLTALACLSKD